MPGTMRWLEEGLDQKLLLTRLVDRIESLSHELKDVSGVINELKYYLQVVHEAELLGDRRIQLLTTENCILYIMRTSEVWMKQYQDRWEYVEAPFELITSALTMFSQRPWAHHLFGGESVPELLVKLLEPYNPPNVQVLAATAVGNLCEDKTVVKGMRSCGVVGALVRLVNAENTRNVQVAAAKSLALLADRDDGVADSVRLVGGIPKLVDMLAVPDEEVFDSARCCLALLGKHHSANQKEILASITANKWRFRESGRLHEAMLLWKTLQGSPAYAPIEAQPMEFRDMIQELCSPVASPSRPSSARKSPAGTAWTPSSPRLTDPSNKHLYFFNNTDVVSLLRHLGVSYTGLEKVRRHKITGSDLLEMEPEDMDYELGFAQADMKTIQKVRKAVKLFDKISHVHHSSYITLSELQEWLKTRGASSIRAGRAAEMTANLVSKDVHSRTITLWSWVTSFDWVVHACKATSLEQCLPSSIRTCAV